MRICHIITRLIVGGAQENTILTCEGLHARGHQVTLIAGPTLGPEGSLLERAMRGGYRFVECPPLVRRVSPWHDWQAYLDLSKMIRDVHPDVVHTHSSKAGILGRMAARRAGAGRIVHTIHGMSFNRTQRFWTRAAFRHAERRCGPLTDHFVCVSDAMARQAVEAGLGPRERFTTVYSGMEVEAFDPSRYDRGDIRSQWGVLAGEVVVGTVARLFRNKGYEDLIPAMAKAAARLPALRFVWIGDGAQRAEYEQRLTELGLRDRVVLTGLVSPAEIPRLLAGIDMLVHASRWEGLPRAVVQALLMEKPAISFDIDGAPEVVTTGQTGMLVRMGDVDGLRDAMVELALRAPTRAAMGAEGRRRCLSQFDWRVMVDQLETVYRADATMPPTDDRGGRSAG